METHPPKTYAILYQTLLPYKWHIVVIGMVGFLSSLVTAVGVSAIVPLLALVIGEKIPGAGMAISIIGRIFEYLPFSYSPETLLLMIVVLFVGKGIFLLTFSYIRARVMFDYRLRTMRDLLSEILYARWSFLLKQKVGHIQNIIVQDVDRSSHLLGSVAHILFAVVSAAVFFVFAFMISSRITLLAMAGGVVLLFILRPVLKKIKATGMEFAGESKKVFQYLLEHLTGLKSVKIAVAEDEVLKKGSASFNIWRRIELKAHMLRSLNKQTIEPASIIFIAVMFLLSYRVPDFRLETFVATIYLVQQLFRNLELMQGAFQDIYESLPHLFYLAALRGELLKEYESRFTKSVEPRPFKFEKSIVFKGVSLSYVPRRTVLSDLSFFLGKGETLGLIGPSGSGKTSIADLMLRLFEPTSGVILLDGVDAQEFNTREWRSNFGYVSQDIFLLNDTIEENIKFYDNSLKREDLILAARQANIYDFINKLPDGFKTVTGDRGVMLSAGQRQRVVLARVLARKPSILVLDEATSALDNESEVLIHKAINDLKRKITVLIIAHRLSTIADVDRILVLDQGKIAEDGPPQKLLANPNSYFYRVYHIK